MVRQILSFVDNAEESAPFLESLVAAAEHRDAHVQIGVLTAAPMLIPALAPLATLYLPEAILATDNELQVSRIRTLLAGAAKRVDIWGLHDSVGWLSADIRDTWHLADLTVIGPRDAWLTPWLRRRVAETLLVSSGTPVVLMPDAQPFPRVGHAVLGWKPSAESCRVVHDLIALAEPGAQIDVATVGPEPQVLPGDELPGSGIEAYLKRHGFSVAMHRFDDGGATSDQLQAFTRARCADLLAIGGYAHARARETFLGGVTRSIIEEPFVPTLMAH